jgi:parallel beta-helix repeat protein
MLPHDTTFMKFLRPCPAALVLGFGCLLVPAVDGQGPLTPPGAPAPTMKTLDQIASSGIAINSTNTPGDATNQFIITAPGHYYLTGNITGVSGKRGILLNINNATVDLNGFAMIGGASNMGAISDGGVNRGNAVICNGTISGWGGTGVDLNASFDSLVHDLIVSNNGGGGLLLGDACVARDCMVRDNGSHNIVTGFNANISNCTAIGSVNGYGFNLGQDSSLRGCVANFNHFSGIFAASGCSISHCTVNENQFGGIEGGNNSTITACSAYKNVEGGIGCGTGSTVVDCSATLNSSVNTIGTGAISVQNGSTISNCSASYNSTPFGIEATPGCTVVHCTAAFNSTAPAFSGGIFVQSCTVIDCTSSNNTNTNANSGGSNGMGIYGVGPDNIIRNCNSSGNAGDGIIVESRSQVKDNLCADNGAAGVHATGSGNRLEGNQLSNNHAAGMLVDSTVNLVIRNAARSNTPNYSIVAGNRVATIITPLTNSAISGDIGGTSFSSDVTVNIVY